MDKVYVWSPDRREGYGWTRGMGGWVDGWARGMGGLEEWVDGYSNGKVVV